MDFGKNLEESESFGEIFSLVKEAVDRSLEKRRDGLMIALQYLPESLGAYYGLGSNFIVMNKALLEKFRLAHDARATKSYVFSILLHEYLHSLGYLEEVFVRDLSYQICRMVFGEGHLATKISKHGIAPFLPAGSERIKVRETEDIDIVESFELNSITYIG